MQAVVLIGDDRKKAVSLIVANHYTKSVPSGKSYYLSYNDALVVWSIPANKNIAKFLLGVEGCVWELSRLWAPDGHERNLLTQAISAGVSVIKRLERPDVLVSYADPNVGHKGGVYKAASWIYCGQCSETRCYRSQDGRLVARRAFHSGRRTLTKPEILALGYEELHLPGKYRYVKPISRSATKLFGKHWMRDRGRGEGR